MADWSLFEEPSPPSPTAESLYTEIKSSTVQLGSQFTQVHDGTIEIRSNNNDAWYDLSDSYIEVKFRITKDGVGVPGVGAGNRTSLGADDVITMVNSGYSLFRRVELSFGDSNVVDYSDLPGRCHLAHAYSRYSAGRLAESEASEWLYAENASLTVGTATAVAAVAPAPGATYSSLGAAILNDPIGHTATDELRAEYLKRNPSYARRFARTRQSRICTLFLPLRAVLGYCDNLNKPIRGIPFQINLERNETWQHVLHSTSTAIVDPRIVVLTCSLWTKIVKPTVEISGLINEQLSQDNLTTSYVFENKSGYYSPEYNPDAAEQIIEWKVQTSVAKPTLVYVGFLSEAQFTRIADGFDPDTVPDDFSAAIASPYELIQHQVANSGLLGSHLNDIRRVEVRINSKQYVTDPYVMSFVTSPLNQNESWQRAYTDFKKVFYRDMPENSKLIDLETWKMAPLFAFKLDNDAGVFQNSKSVDITVRANVLSTAFNPGVAASGSGKFHAYAIVYSERQLKVQALDGRIVMYT